MWRSGTMIALLPAASICAQSPCSRVPPAAVAARALSRVRSASDSTRRSATRSPAICVRASADLRCHPLRGQHRQLRQRADRNGRPGDGRLWTRGNAGEHEHTGEHGRAGERRDTEPVAARPREGSCRRGDTRRRCGRAAHTIQSAPSSATFVQNSVTWGAINSTASRATASA